MGREVDLARLRVDDRRVRLELGAGAGDELAVAPCRGRGDVADAELRLRSALRDHLAVDDLEVGGVDLHLLAGDLEDLLLHLERRLLGRLAGDERRA